MQVQNDGGAAGTIASGHGAESDSGMDHDYDQDNDAHHVIQPQLTDTDEASTDTDEG